MRVPLLNAVITFAFGLAAAFCWWFLWIMGWGETDTIVVMCLYLFGIVPGLVGGIVLGRLRHRTLTVTPLLIGWALAMLLTPPVLMLANPVNASMPAGEKAIIIGTMILFPSSGILGTRIGMRRQ